MANRIPTKAWALRRVAGVLVAGAMERARRMSALGVDEVPRSPDEIGVAWLTGVLCSRTTGARVSAVRKLGRGEGTTTRRALKLTYNDIGVEARLPTMIFAKSTTALAQRLMLGLGGFLYGEPGFYAHIRPQLRIEAPVGYFGAVDPRSWRSITLIEDVVATRGASFWAPRLTLARGQIENLLAEAAAWHGALWDSPCLARCRWLRTPADQMHRIDALIAMADRRRIGAERAGAVIPPRLRERQADLYEGMRRSMEANSRGPRTYLHGDLHVANTYLTAAGTLGVVDWQAGLQGSWAQDYSYIVSSALDIEDRRAWERELLDFYLERLVAAGGEAIPREEAWRAYRTGLFYPYFAWVYTIGRARVQPNFQPEEVSLAMIERISAAVDDLESLRAVGL